MISIILADDQTLLRDGLQTMINLQEDMQVVGVGSSGEQVLELVSSKQPDIILMDIQMPGMNGLECTRRIKSTYPNVKVLILTTFAEDDYIVESFSAGANGFLMKDLPGDQLVQSIRDAMNGSLLLPSVIATRIVALMKPQEGGGTAKIKAEKLRTEGIVLSQREREIAEMLVQKKTNRQIAKLLYMSEGTVRNYISAIYNKIGTSDREYAASILERLM